MGYRGHAAGLSKGAAVLALGLILAAGSLAPVSAQAINPGERIVKRIDLIDADLRSAVQFLRAQTGIEIVIEANDKPYGSVTLSLSDRPLADVMRLVCQSARAAFREEGGIFVIGPQDAKPRIQEVVPVKAAAPIVRTRSRMEKIRLVNSRPTEILYYMGIDQGPNNRLVHDGTYKNINPSFNPYHNVPRGQPPIQDLNGPVQAQQVPPIVPTNGGSGNPADGRTDEFNQLGGGRLGGGGGGLGGGGGGRLGGGGLGGGLGGGGLGGGGLGGGGLGGGLGGGQGGGGAAAGALLPEGIEAVIGYDLDNSIIVVYTDDDAFREMRKRVALLDIAPRQVMIRAEFVTLSQNDLRTFGIDWQVARGNLLAGNSGFAGGPIFLNYATGNVVAQLRATLTEGRARLINSPMATTLNNVPVTLQIGRQVPVFITSPVAAGNGTVVLATQLIPVPVVSGLTVLPRINGDESISMFVSPFLADIVDTVTGPDGSTAPIIATQGISVNRRIRNGETMVIGGLISKNDSTSVRRVPLFGDLPLIGGLFQGRSVTVSDSELLIFVTPYIIRDTPAGGATVGGAESGGVPGGIRP